MIFAVFCGRPTDSAAVSRISRVAKLRSVVTCLLIVLLPAYGLADTLRLCCLGSTAEQAAALQIADALGQSIRAAVATDDRMHTEHGRALCAAQCHGFAMASWSARWELDFVLRQRLTHSTGRMQERPYSVLEKPPRT